MSLQLVPYYKIPFHYATNALYSVTSNTTLTINAGQFRDVSNTIDLVLPATSVLNTAAVGLNGLDSGILAASTWYYVYIIGDSSGFNPVGTILSTSATAPVLPFGYDVMAFIGFALTDGSTHFIPSYVIGSGSYRQLFWKDSISVLSGGTSATFAAVSLAVAVPPVDMTKVNLNISFTPNAAGDICQLRPTGAGTSVLTLSGVVAAKAQQLQAELLSFLASGAAKIDYLVTASGALSISVLGFSYNA